MKKKTIIQVLILLFAIAVIFIGSKYSQIGKNKYFTAVYTDVFDTVTYISGYAKSEDDFMVQADKLHNKLKEYHKYYDIYHAYDGLTNLKNVNDMAGQKVSVDEPIIDLLKKSVEIYELTDGKTNIALGSVLQIWHDYRSEGIENPDNARLPEKAVLMEKGQYTDLSKMMLDANSVILPNNMALDVGSVAKGYAADRIAEYAREMGMQNLLISIGGNVVAIDGKEDGSAWKIGIVDPIEAKKGNNDKYAEAVSVHNGCVVTSGDYQRYYTVNGVDYCHIIQPETYMPAQEYASVTIIGEESVMADALSTALFCMSLDEGKALLERLPGYEAMWIYPNGEKVMSEGFSDYIGD